MPLATVSDLDLPVCAQCGLPVRTAASDRNSPVFCCHACRVVAGIIGGRSDGDHAWNLLRLGFGALLAMNIMMLALLLYSGAVETEAVPIFRWVMLILATPAMAILLFPLAMTALQQCLQRKPGLDLLIVGGSVAAFSVSAMNTLRNTGQVFFDTATMLPVLVTFGKMIESTAKTRAADLLHAMETLLPQRALRITDGTAMEVPLDELQPGNMVRIRPGERIAVDGTIREGSTMVEEAAFTGEPLPHCRGPGDRVLAGTVNGQGSLLVETDQTGKDILLRRIVAMVHRARENPSAAERLAEQAARLFVPLVVVVSLLALIFWALAGNPLQGGLSALSVLVVACPCTMGIATPLATSLAIARAAAAGIVVRGGDAMEALGGTDTIFFDKTGTLTLDQPVLSRIIVFDPQLTEEQLLVVAAGLESASSHPLARAISAEAAKRGLTPKSSRLVTLIQGLGISGLVELNGASRMVTAGAPPLQLQTERETMAVDLTWDGCLRGRLLFQDSIRNGAARAVKKLVALGITPVLLSGDRREAAVAIAAQTGITRVEAPRNPVEKVELVEKAVGMGKKVAMAGDGVNDAAALAAAHVGIALGSGLDLARVAGRVVLLSDRLAHIPWLIGLSRQTRRIIGENFAWSFGYNAIAIGAAAAGLLHPLLAAIAMVVSSMTILSNSMRISRYQLEES